MAPQTGIAALDWFLAQLIAWGYLIVVGFTFFENMFVVGSFTPGETVVVAASFIASTGELYLPGVFAASLLGTLLGSNFSYVLGRRAGVEGVRRFAKRAARTRPGRLFRIHPALIDDVHEHFHTEGSRTIFISRFAVGAKNFVPAIAGAVRMPFVWFELYTVLGAFAYTAIMCAIGWLLGRNIEAAVRVAGSVGWFGLVVLVLFVAAVVMGRNRLRARRAALGGDGCDDDTAQESAPDFDDAE